MGLCWKLYQDARGLRLAAAPGEQEDQRARGRVLAAHQRRVPAVQRHAPRRAALRHEEGCYCRQRALRELMLALLGASRALPRPLTVTVLIQLNVGTTDHDGEARGRDDGRVWGQQGGPPAVLRDRRRAVDRLLDDRLGDQDGAPEEQLARAARLCHQLRAGHHLAPRLRNRQQERARGYVVSLYCCCGCRC